MTFLLVQAVLLAPLKFVQEHGAELGELVGRVFECAEDDRPLVDREREQLYIVVEGLFEPEGKVDGPCGSDDGGESERYAGMTSGTTVAAFRWSLTMASLAAALTLSTTT